MRTEALVGSDEQIYLILSEKTLRNMVIILIKNIFWFIEGLLFLCYHSNPMQRRKIGIIDYCLVKQRGKN